MTVKMSSAVLYTNSMTGEDGMMTTVTNPWDISAKDVSAAATQQACLYHVVC